MIGLWRNVKDQGSARVCATALMMMLSFHLQVPSGSKSSNAERIRCPLAKDSKYESCGKWEILRHGRKLRVPRREVKELGCQSTAERQEYTDVAWVE